jgi:outer membrane autotransporter protein
MFATYYPDPLAGLNVHAFIGYGRLSLTIDGQDQDIGDLTGVVLGAGAGYDFWVGKQWSLGPAARLTYGALGGDQGGVEATETWVSPSILFEVTFH